LRCGTYQTGAMFKALASLTRPQIFVLQLSVVQFAFAVAACGLLGERSTRTGWAQDFGAGAAATCAFDPLLNALFIYAGNPSLTKRIFSYVFVILCFAGIVSLVSNTEDDQHPGIVDKIEVSVSLLAVAWGAQCSRLALEIMEVILYSTHAYKRSLMLTEELTII